MVRSPSVQSVVSVTSRTKDMIDSPSQMNPAAGAVQSGRAMRLSIMPVPSVKLTVSHR